MTQKLIVVVGATCGQGGSVIPSFLKDRNYKIRGLTRNPKSERAKDLSVKGVEMVIADLDDLASVGKAFAGANVIFAITDHYDNFWTKGWERSMEIEYAQGINMDTAAGKVAAMLEHICGVLSLTPPASAMGKQLYPIASLMSPEASLRNMDWKAHGFQRYLSSNRLGLGTSNEEPIPIPLSCNICVSIVFTGGWSVVFATAARPGLQLGQPFSYAPA